MPELTERAAELSRLTGADVEPVAYDVGYWSRVLGRGSPQDSEEQDGWIQADKELESEDA